MGCTPRAVPAVGLPAEPRQPVMRRRPTATARAETPSGGSPAGVSGGGAVRAVYPARDDAGLVSGGFPRPSTLGLSLAAGLGVLPVCV
jgi:hypothetical protein